MKLVISQELVKEFFKYNEQTGVFTWKARAREHFGDDFHHKVWNTRYANTVAGSPSSDGYLRISINNVKYKSHRLAFLYVYGYMPKNIDHINHDGKDNRIINLREVSHQENHKNQRKSKNNTSGMTGVTWRKDTSKWCAQIMIDGKCKSLGSFGDKKDAIAARKAANIKYGFHKRHGK